MDKRDQDRFKKTIIDDLELIDSVINIMMRKLENARKEKTRLVSYYENFIIWCQNLRSNLLELAGISKKEEIQKVELTQEQLESIVLMRTNNPFYKRVLAEYAKEQIEDLLALLEDELELENYLDFDVRNQLINTRRIKEHEEKIKELVKEKVKGSKIKVPISERSRYNSLEDYIEVYVRILADSNGKLEVRKIPAEIFENIQDLSQKVQILRNEGIIDTEQNTYYHGILYHLAEYYVGISEGEQLTVDEGLREIKVDKDLFLINQFIAEALYEVTDHSKKNNQKNEKIKIFTR